MVEDGGPAWAPTRALGRAVLVTGLLLLAAVVLGRPDLVALAAPFALGTALSLRRRPVAVPRVRLAVDEEFTVEGGDMAASVVVGNRDEIDYDLVVARLQPSTWLRVHNRADAEPDPAAPADRPMAASAPAGADADLAVRATALRWGRHPLGPAAARAVACGGLLASAPVVVDARVVRAYPLTEPFDAVEAMPRAAGLVGGHRSRRPGEGGELAGVRVFVPGDRLRRVDWRVSLRARELHVAATLSDRDAEVVLLLDVLTEAGHSGGVRGTASVLDTTVRAAAAIAEHYLHRGDRVSMLEYGTLARRLRPGSGRRQYLTALEWLLDVQAAEVVHEPIEHVFGGPVLSSNALLVVLTPLIDTRSAGMLARLARSGRFVVAVDTLPSSVLPTERGTWTELAYRVWRLDRDNTIGQLREHGVPVVAWAGAGSLDLVLRDVARLASAPRAGAR
ncbi:MAG TPA: DUF58 domain-containing protein [Pilimelia sp.]|nr:DUF58 domain-containing protein [Pilimelia sp.]